jgi:hypothetical protein
MFKKKGKDAPVETAPSSTKSNSQIANLFEQFAGM